MDFLSGSFDGRPYWARGTADGGFETPEMVRNQDGGELILGAWWDYDGGGWQKLDEPHALSVAVLDADNDGDLDLVQGTSKGGLYLCRNIGTKEKPVFANGGEAIGGEIKSGYSMPIAADWDGDGDQDLVCGSDSGAVYLVRNDGKGGFDAPVVLLAAHIGEPGTGPATDTQVAVGDLNGDGLMDLMVGDNSSRRDDSHLTEEQRSRGEEIQRELMEMSEVLQAYYGDDEEAKAALDPKDVERMHKLMELQREFSPKYVRNGFVWMYLQKATEGPAIGLGGSR